MKKNLILMRRRVMFVGAFFACACTLLKVSAMQPWQQSPGQDVTQPAPVQNAPVQAPAVEVTASLLLPSNTNLSNSPSHIITSFASFNVS